MTYKEYLSIAIPFVISTVTQPLLGAVDTAVLGRLEDAAFMAGVAISAVIFNTLYWLLGFLRVSTSGFAAQSLGTDDEKDSLYAFLRPSLIAVALSIIFIVLQNPIKIGAQTIFNADLDVWHSAVIYYDILIWGAPFVLIGYVNLGWLMGKKLIKETLYLQVSMNVINIVLDIILVLYFDMGVYGVAYATLFSQAYGFILGAFLVVKRLSLKAIFSKYDDLLEKEAFRKIVGVNTNLFIRTVCLLIMTNMFVAKGSSFGKEILAANAVLFQIQYIIAYLYDGFANASSVFAGKAVGAKSLKEYKKLLLISNISTIVLSIIIVIIFSIFSGLIIRAFTDLQNIVNISNIYSSWLILFTAVIAPGIVYSGFYNGAIYTSPIRDTMLISLGVFIVAYYLFIPMYNNHGLWLAFILFSLSRSVMLYIYLGKMERFLFPEI